MTQSKKNLFIAFFSLIFVYFLGSQESLLDSKNLLRSHLLEDEALYFTKEQAGAMQSIILQYDSRVIVKKYDALAREFQRNIYEQSDTEDILLASEAFFYMDDSLVAYKKIGIDYEGDLYFESLYDKKGRLMSLEKKAYDKVKKEAGKSLVKESYLWDEKDRLIQKEEVFEKSRLRYENSYEKSFSNEFIYDQKKFLNDSLQEEKIYTDASSYINIHYFSNMLKTFSFYTDGVKTEEIFYQADRVLRRVLYD